MTLQVSQPLVSRSKITVNWPLRIMLAVSLAAHVGALAWFLLARPPTPADYTPQHVDVDVVWADEVSPKAAPPAPPAPQAPPPQQPAQQAQPPAQQAQQPAQQAQPTPTPQQPIEQARQAPPDPPPPNATSAEPAPQPPRPAPTTLAAVEPPPPPAPPPPTETAHPPAPPVHGAPEVAAAIRVDVPFPVPDPPAPAAEVASSGNPTVGDAPPAYVADILVRLQRALVYPAKARPGRLQGHLVIQFAVTRAGEVVDLAVVQSSGKAMFDQAALDMVRRAAPFPPLPADYEGNTMPFTTPVRFIVR